MDQSTRHQKIQQNYYDREYSLYNDLEISQNWRLSITRKVLEALKPSPADVFVDIGVGGSGYTVIAAAKMGIWSIGTDISVDGMRKAKVTASKLLANQSEFCEFVACSATYLPFRNESVGKISTMAVLEHIAEDGQAIEEFSRILKRFGSLFINVPNSYSRIPFIFILPYMFHDRRVGHLRHYKAEDLELLFGKRGLAVADVFYTGHMPKIMQFVFQKIFSYDENVGSNVWWFLEKLDNEFRHIPSGLQLFMLFRYAENRNSETSQFSGKFVSLKKTCNGMDTKE